MLTRPLGDTGLRTSVLGFGAMQAGDPGLPERRAEQLLNGVLDLGIGLIDTARSYGLSEERIGRYLARRRDEFVLSTKVGYGISGCADWTPECIRRGVEEARQRLRTDVIDIVHLHSCPAEVLADQRLSDALQDARDAGKIGIAAYSGDGDALRHALATRQFGAVQISFNLVDQDNMRSQGSQQAFDGIGVIAKRTLAGAPWAPGEPTAGSPEACYRERFADLEAVVGHVDDWADVALRFAAFSDGVNAVLVGSTRLGHLEENIQALARGPLPRGVVKRLSEAYVATGRGWSSIV